MARLPRRLGNACAAAVLRSPFHRLMSGSLILLSFSGRRSGKEHTRPLSYAEAAGDLIIFAGHVDAKAWWRNLEDGAPVKALVRGITYDGTGTVVRGDSALAGAYAAHCPRTSGAIDDASDPVFVRVSALRAR